jgi:hypothetical protein
MLALALVVTLIAALSFAYVFAVRPWHLAWGATHLDRVSALPGDALSPRAGSQVTHAIEIAAPPEAVWPWIVQIGQDRAGFYSYTFLENLVGCDMHNTKRIVPEWQSRSPGDTVWFTMPKRYGGRGRMVAGIVEPGKAFVFVTPADWERVKAGDEGLDTTWAFALKPSFGGRTRLVARLRGAAFPGLGTRMANYLFWEPAHFVMERKMLLTIKELAEKKS